MKSSQRYYLAFMTAVGVVSLAWVTSQLIQQELNLPLLASLLILGITFQVISKVSESAGITFSITQPVSLAATAVAGLPTGIIVATISSISLWVINTYMGKKNWRGTIAQLCFNTSMIIVVELLAGSLLLWLHTHLPNVILAHALAWTSAAIVADQLNLLIVLIMVYLAQKTEPWQFWRERVVTQMMNILVTATGGALLTTLIFAIGWQGVFVACIPLLLTVYIFQTHIQRYDARLSQLKNQADQLTRTNEQLEELIRIKNRFLTVLSHDMRTSLSSIRMSLEMLEDQSLLLSREKRARMLDIIGLNERSLTNMVNNILEIEQIQAGQHRPLEIARLNLTEVIENNLAAMRGMMAYKQVRAHHYTHHTPVIVEGDSYMIEQIVQNLLSNAIKYTPTKGRIFISVNIKGNDVVLDVEDTGIGIPQGELENIFRPYYRVPEHIDKATGTGLGLSIVQRYVQAHNGRIEVESKEMLGTRFSIYIPIAREPLSADSVATSFAPQQIVKNVISTHYIPTQHPISA